MKKIILSLIISCISLVSYAVTISGASTVCVGATTTLSGSPSGGTWSSSNPAIATIGSSSGIVTGVTAGVDVITYVYGTTTPATFTITVNPLPSPISGNTTVCAGTTVQLSDPTPGGTWSSSNTTVATIGSASGLVTTISSGTTTITYTLSTGCSVSAIISVLANPAPISGPNSVCVGGTITLSDATAGGIWSSTTSSIATVGSSSGVVTGVSPGTDIISYAIAYSVTTSCYATYSILVNPTPSPIMGSSTGTVICSGTTIALSDATPGGTWSSSNTTVATVGSSSGLVTTLSPGTTTITYTLSTGCSVSSVIVVVAGAAPISGPTSLCVGATITLSDATAGGTWSSSNTSVATVGSSSGIVTGVSAGHVIITYTISSGCSVTYTITVNPNPSPISGGSSTFVCSGTTIQLSDAIPGGTWSSSNTSVATIGSSSGLVTTISPGTTTITYTLPTGCSITTIMVVVAGAAPISGPTSLCVNATITLSDATAGGTWSSSNTSIATVGSSSGIVTGVSAGNVIITYTIPSGCYATYTVTVNPNPSPISGGTSLGTPLVVCAGNTIQLSDALPGGTWSSSNTYVATIGSASGLLTALAPGTTTITYTLPTGCSVSTIISVIGAIAPISGPASVCVGSTITLSDASAGGTWSSSNTSIATVGLSSGIVTGVSAGVVTITYMVSSGCYATYSITVNPIPSPILGSTIGTTVCAGSTVALSDATPGGTWSSSNTSVATVGSSSGIVTTLTPGNTTITYTLPTGCSVSTVITVVAGPGPITGPTSVCVGSTISLTDATAGGDWSSSNTSVATIGSANGLVTALSPGNTTITYKLFNGCSVSVTITVFAKPAPISGQDSLCVGTLITLTDATAGGTWNSSNPSVATIGLTTGVLTGVAAGTTVITYTATSGCFVTYTVTVLPLPCTLGINESSITNNIVEIFPNPAFDELTVKIFPGEYNSFIITNEVGQVMLRSQLSSAQTTVNIKSLPSGFYYVIVTGDNGSKAQKFVKM